MRGEHLPGAAVRLVEARGAGVRQGAAQLGQNVTLLSSISTEGMGPPLAVEGPTTREVFETYLEEVLAPTLSPGRIAVMDNL